MADFLYGTIQLIDFVVTITAAFIVLKKDPSYRLNQLMALTLFFFSGLYGFEAPIHLLDISDLVLLNVLQKLYNGSAVIAAGIFLFAGYYMRYGEENQYIIAPLIGLVTVMAAVIGVLDKRTVLREGELVSENGILSFFGVYFYPLICIVISYYFFISVYRETEEEQVKRKIRMVIIGMTLITLGVIYFGLRDLIITSRELAAVSGYVGHVFYLSGDICIFLGFK